MSLGIVIRLKRGWGSQESSDLSPCEPLCNLKTWNRLRKNAAVGGHWKLQSLEQLKTLRMKSAWLRSQGKRRRASIPISKTKHKTRKKDQSGRKCSSFQSGSRMSRANRSSSVVSRRSRPRTTCLRRDLLPVLFVINMLSLFLGMSFIISRRIYDNFLLLSPWL